MKKKTRQTCQKFAKVFIFHNLCSYELVFLRYFLKTLNKRA